MSAYCHNLLLYLISIECNIGCAICSESGSSCFTCQQGYFFLNSACLPCDSSCLSCNGASNIDCIECLDNFLLLNSTCIHDCPNGYILNNFDLCDAKCADGFIFDGPDFCDDGNSADGDGCSSTCHIEEGFQILNVSGNIIIQKETLPTFNLTLPNKNNLLLRIAFSEAMDILNISINHTNNINITIKGLLYNQDYIWEITNIKNNSIDLYFIYSNSFRSTPLSLQFTNLQQYEDFSGNQLQNDNESIQLYIYDYCTQTETNFINSTQKVSDAASSLINVWGYLILNIITSSDEIWSFLFRCQDYGYFVFINIDIPDNLKTLLNSFNFMNRKQALNIFDEYANSYDKFDSTDVNGIFLSNSGISLCIILVLLIASGILYTLNKYITNQSSNARKMVDFAIKKQFNVKWLISFTLFLPHNLLSSFIQLYQMKYNGHFLWVNNLLNYIFLLSSITFLIFMYKLSEEENAKDRNHYSEIWLDYEIKEDNFQYFPFLDYIKRFNIIITLAFLQKYPIIQAFLIIINSCLLTVIFLLSKPIENKAKRWLKLISEIQGLIIGIFILVFDIDNYLQMMNMITRKNLGWIACAMTILVIVVNLGYMIYIMFTKLIQHGKKLMKKNDEIIIM